jgi:HK97 family phage major capsid protein
MNSTTRLLDEQRRQTWAAARAILDTAQAEGRDLTAAEQVSWDRANVDLDNLDARLRDLQDREARTAATERAFAGLGVSVPNGPATGADRDVDLAFRDAVLNNERRPIEVEPTGVRSGTQPGIERRDLSSSGFVPSSFYSRVLMHAVDSSAVLAAGATVIATPAGGDYKVPRSTADASAAIISEGGTVTESDPTLGTVTLGAYKFGFSVQVTNELATDSTFDLVGYLAEMSGRAIANGFGAYAVTGTGSSQPAGVVTGATLGVTGGTSVAGAFTGDNLIDLYHSLPEPVARARAAGWLMKNGTLGAVRKLKDSQNRYLFEVDVPPGSGASGTLLGRPVYADPNVAAVATSAKSVVFGDFSRYFVRLAGPLRFERSDEVGFLNDLITFRALARIDGAVVDASGFKYFAGGAS